jgi:hypothetical protein
MLISNNDGLFVMSFYWMGSRGRSFLPHTKTRHHPRKPFVRSGAGDCCSSS